MEPFDLTKWSGYRAAGGNPSQAAITDQVVIDSRRVGSKRALFVALSGTTHDGHHFVASAGLAGARYAVVQRCWRAPDNLPPTIQLLRVEDPLRALQEIAQTYRRGIKAAVLAVTGSQGKTMLKDMLQAVLSDSLSVVSSPESFNSQIGVALSILHISAQHQLAIIEAGISQVGEMDHLAKLIAPDYTILTTIGEQHIDTLGDTATIAREKMKLALAIPEDGWVILPSSTSSSHPGLKDQTGRRICWDQVDPTLPYAVATPGGGFIVHCPDGIQARGQLHFGFSYLLDLINIAIRAAWLIGVPSRELTDRIVHYRPESRRTELWRAPTGVTLINSPYSADTQSIDLALARLQETPLHSRRFFVFGGLRAQTSSPADLCSVARNIQRAGVRTLLLYGDQDLNPMIQELGTAVEVLRFPDPGKALEALKDRTHIGDHILVKGPSKPPLDSLIEVFDDNVGHNRCSINLPSVHHNLQLLRQRLQPHARMMVIVKALAYGTEDMRMAHFLASCGIDILGVSYIDEGVALKRAGVPQAVFSLNVAPYEVRKAVRWGLEVGVQSREVLKLLAEEASRQGKRVKVHLHIDTGMGRLGCRPEDAEGLALFISEQPSIILEGIMTHLSCAEDPQQDAFTLEQADLLTQIVSRLEQRGIRAPYVHAANSAALLRFPHLPFNMARIGLALYGLHSSPATQQVLNLKLAISLSSRIVGINVCRKGDSVSYGRSYRVQESIEHLAVIPLGYFDGIHRHYSGKGSVMVRGQLAPMVGNICMDYLMINITHIPDVQVGDPVLLFGQDEYGRSLQPETLAAQGNSIVHELVSCLGPRIQRVFVYE